MSTEGSQSPRILGVAWGVMGDAIAVGWYLTGVVQSPQVVQAEVSALIVVRRHFTRGDPDPTVIPPPAVRA